MTTPITGISVIVVTYNQADTIARTLDSILCQRLSVPMEIIVGEDASTDHTRQICEEYARRYPETVKLMPKAPNKGVVTNYFDCIKASRYQLLADCAGDDYWTDPLKLQREYDVLAAHPEVTLVHTDWTSGNNPHPDEDTCQPVKPLITFGKVVQRQILSFTGRTPVHLCTALYRKQPIEGMLLSSNSQMLCNPDFGCEDLPIILACAQAGMVAYLPCITLHYTTGGDDAITSDASPRKAATFALRQLTARNVLAAFYKVDPHCLSAYNSEGLRYVLSLAFSLRDAALRNAALEVARRWNIRYKWRARILRLAMRIPLVWHIAATLRQR